MLSEVAAEVTQDLLLGPKSSQKSLVDRGDEDDVTRRKRKPKKKKEQNTYQSKRGVEFTDRYVLFAGTVWCSSYYICSIGIHFFFADVYLLFLLSSFDFDFDFDFLTTAEIDGIKYTSSTQFVMSEQARLFGDEARRQELLAASNAAAPHREFDHKAPKTGVRRVNNFDADVWKTYKERLMWRGTYEKFTQNPTLRHKALEAGTRYDTHHSYYQSSPLSVLFVLFCLPSNYHIQYICRSNRGSRVGNWYMSISSRREERAEMARPQSNGTLAHCPRTAPARRTGCT